MGEDHNLRRSPRFAAQRKRKINDNSNKLNKLRKRLEIRTNDTENDFQSEINSSIHADGGAGNEQPPADEAVPENLKRIQPPATRCSPSMFQRLLAVISDGLKELIRGKGFGGLLQFKPNQVDRHLARWLMQRLNPDTMKLELGGGQEIPVTEHSVWCVFQLPNSGGDPPSLTEEVARHKRNVLARQVWGSSYDPQKNKIFQALDIVTAFDQGRLTGELALRCFFIVAFHSLLFSNTGCKIRNENVGYTEDLDHIGNKNWCKSVVDELCKAARLYRKDYASKGEQAPISGCCIFLNVSFSSPSPPFTLCFFI